MTLTDGIATIINNLVSFIMGIRYSSADLAYYTKGAQIPFLFRDNIFATLITVLFPAMSKVSDDDIYLKRMLRKANSLAAYVIFPIMFGFIAINRSFVLALFTEKWIGMCPYIVIICFASVLSVTPTIGFQAIKALGRSDILLKNELMTKPVYVICVVAGMPFGPLGMAFGVLVAYFYCSIVACVFVKKIMKYGLKEQVEDIMRPLLMALAMMLVVWSMELIGVSSVIRLVLQILCGGSVYILMSVATKDSSFIALRDIIVKKIPRLDNRKNEF